MPNHFRAVKVRTRLLLGDFVDLYYRSAITGCEEATTLRFGESGAKVEDLRGGTDCNRRIVFWGLRLSWLKSQFFNRTYCFPRRVSSPDSIISAISRLTNGLEQPIISARSS